MTDVQRGGLFGYACVCVGLLRQLGLYDVDGFCATSSLNQCFS